MATRGRKPKREEVSWSPELAYAIGLIATDGCLSNDGRHITLVSKDSEQLRNLARCLSLEASIKRYLSGRKNERTWYYRMQWSDTVLYRFLLSIGLTPNKSKTIGRVHIPDTYFFDFLRGSFDGDGSFYSYFDPRWRSSYLFYVTFASASGAHMAWMRAELERLIGVRGHVSTAKQSVVTQLRYGKKEGLEILKRMYRSPEEASLSRKRLKVERSLRIIHESLSDKNSLLTK